MVLSQVNRVSFRMLQQKSPMHENRKAESKLFIDGSDRINSDTYFLPYARRLLLCLSHVHWRSYSMAVLLDKIVLAWLLLLSTRSERSPFAGSQNKEKRGICQNHFISNWLTC